MKLLHALRMGVAHRTPGLNSDSWGGCPWCESLSASTQHWVTECRVASSCAKECNIASMEDLSMKPTAAAVFAGKIQRLLRESYIKKGEYGQWLGVRQGLGG